MTLKYNQFLDKVMLYRHGKPVEELERELGISDVVKLASNENPLGPSPKAIEAIMRAASQVHLYPDPGSYYLVEKLAERFNLSPNHFVLDHGGDPLLRIMAQIFVAPGDQVLTFHPSFPIFTIAGYSAQGEMVYCQLDENMTLDLGKLAEMITDRTRLIYLANPNNPTGTVFNQADFAKFMDNIDPDIVVVHDEAYYDFVDLVDYPDALEYIKQGRNLIMLRTFSKAYGLAGLRIGYAITKPAIVDLMTKLKPVFTPTLLAQQAAIAALDDFEHLKASQKLNQQGREYFYDQFERLGIRYFESQANFVLIECTGKAEELYERLLREGVIVRPILGDYLRITIGTMQQNARLVAGLEKVL